MSDEILTPDEMLRKWSEITYPNLDQIARISIQNAMRAYATQEIEHSYKHFIDQRNKALDERDNARIWVKSLQKDRDEAQQQAKQLQEERRDILESLFSIRDMVHGTPWAVVNTLIDQLNQQNEK